MTYPIVLISIMGLYSHQHGSVCFKVFKANSGEEFHQLVSNAEQNVTVGHGSKSGQVNHMTGSN